MYKHDEPQKIKFSVVSVNGDDEFEMFPADALEEMKRLVNNHGKWLYEDGDIVNVMDLTPGDLNPNRDYELGNLLKGGVAIDESCRETESDGCCCEPEGRCDETSKQLELGDPQKYFYSTQLNTVDNQEFDFMIWVNDEKKEITGQLRKDRGRFYVANRDDIAEILYSVLHNLSVVETRKIAEPLNVPSYEFQFRNTRTRIAEGYNFFFDVSGDPMITLNYDIKDNILTVGINNNLRFRAMKHQRELKAFVGKQMVAFGQQYVQDMAKLTGLRG